MFENKQLVAANHQAVVVLQPLGTVGWAGGSGRVKERVCVGGGAARPGGAVCLALPLREGVPAGPMPQASA